MPQFPVLVLNLDYSPWDVWDWQHAMKKYLCSANVDAVYNEDGLVKYDRVLRDGKGNRYEQPAVLILSRYISAHGGRAPYTKLNIYARDYGICQYCGKYTPDYKSTIDHVIPRAHWNPRRFHFKLNSFENVVTCCDPCNKKKANRTPQQAGMTLIRKPRAISRTEAYSRKMSMITNKPEQWSPYLKAINVS